MKEVSGRASALLRTSCREGRSHADAARASTNTPTTRVRDRAAMVPPSCHGWKQATASLRAMGPKDLPTLLAGSAEVVPAEELEHKLSLARPLRVKLGLDPTAPVVTLGWAVVLHKLRQFQDAGHTAVLIVGDFTAQVGDPSGKTETRPRLSEEEVRGYAERLLDQFWKILDPERTEVRYNAEWLGPMGMEAILRLTASTTVARMLERDDFAKRYAQGKPISIMEFLYPLLQGMDSVAVEADVELGGRDQTFNLLVGRHRRRAEDESVPRQLHRHHRSTGRHVRQARPGARRADPHVPAPRARLLPRPLGGRAGGQGPGRRIARRVEREAPARSR